MLPLLTVSGPATLEAGALWRLPEGQSLKLLALDGTLWMSQPQEPGDIIVEAGQSIELDVAGLTIVEAIGQQAKVWISVGEAARIAA
ncbi:MAG TPA: DUF2917 domain-containing protein [Hyphomicrobiaceae bacterium]|nr:DUF2917 domain-containing protein [Hyphomicrobiaceae bacterium]